MQLHEEYRPTSWADVVGQEKVLDKLSLLRQRGLAGRSYWLTGGSGTGKSTIARLISLVEDQSPLLGDVARALAPFTGGAHVVGLTGAPGVGKSTLLGLVAGLDRADAGTVAFDGTDLGSLDDDAVTLLRRLWRQRLWRNRLRKRLARPDRDNVGDPQCSSTENHTRCCGTPTTEQSRTGRAG